MSTHRPAPPHSPAPRLASLPARAVWVGLLVASLLGCDPQPAPAAPSASSTASTPPPLTDADPLSPAALVAQAQASRPPPNIRRAPPSRPGVVSEVEAVPREHRLTAPGLLSLDIRLGASHILPAGDTVYVAARVRAARDLQTPPDPTDPTDPTSPQGSAQNPAHIALLLDRSGSMAERDAFQNAKRAAEWLIRDLGPQDFFSVIAYDDRAEVIWPASPATADARDAAIAALHALPLGGHTCVSCALTRAADQAAAVVASPHAPPSLVQRVILLSDGKPTHGVQSVSGLSALVRDLERRHVTTTTIGLGLLFGEDLLSALALHGNGNHYFVEDPATLSQTLRGELACVRQVVARAATLHLTLRPGVRFVEGFERAFSVSPDPLTGADTVTISLGDLHPGAEATVLLALAIDPLPSAPSSAAQSAAPPASADAPRPVVGVALRYDDITRRAPAAVEGTLYARAARSDAERADALDTEVAARVEQALIAHAIEQANAELRLGHLGQAQTIIRQQSQRSAAQNDRLQSDALGASLRALQTIDQSLDQSLSAPRALPNPTNDARLLRDNAELNLRLKK